MRFPRSSFDSAPDDKASAALSSALEGPFPRAEVSSCHRESNLPVACIEGVCYHNIDSDGGLDRCMDLLEAHESDPKVVFFLNIDCLKAACDDKRYFRCLQKADLLLPDGIGLHVASKFFGIELSGNCNGTDFVPLFLERAAEKGQTVYLLGGRDGIAERAARQFQDSIPNLKIAGYHHGYSNDPVDVIDTINKSGTDILLVAKGTPIQEKWIAENIAQLDVKVCFGVGGLFDFVSQRIPRAPLLMRRNNLEWLWRMLIEPRRLTIRYFRDFAFLIQLWFRSLR